MPYLFLTAAVLRIALYTIGRLYTFNNLKTPYFIYRVDNGI